MARRYVAPLMTVLGTNSITLLGASLTTVAVLIIGAFVLLGLLGLANSPYVAVMVLLVLPGIFVLGLLLIPTGVLWEKRKARLEGSVGKAPRLPYPTIDFNRAHVRRVAVSIGALTVINLLVVSILSYEGVVYMESTEFCGQVCHTVMQPEFSAYQGSPHSRVSCVQCHIGPGAPWFVRSKLSGLGQVVAVTLHTYPTPISSPVAALRPSQDICENCHWPDQFTGDRMKVITHYSEDEANTPLKSVLLMHIGGADQGNGIHSWHINPKRETYYYSTDERRQEIAWVQVDEGDEVVVFSREGFELPEGAEASLRRMDCVDCHNRPTHAFQLPSNAMDRAMARGWIDPSIPFIRKIGKEVMVELGERLAASEEVTPAVISRYEQEVPEHLEANREKVESAASYIQQIYARNVFPKMNLSWGFHPQNIGHDGFSESPFPGCFRCHDGSLTSADGRSIEQNCDDCHTILAMEEENPSVLSELGID